MQITLRGQSFKVDSNFEESIGVYGKVFWEKVGSSAYEIDTFIFIEKSFQKGKRTFVDIGSATGCMSLFAASLGFKVLAFEPQSEIFDALRRNVSLNPELGSRIECNEALLISGYTSSTDREFFTKGAEGPLSTVASNLKTVDTYKFLSEVNHLGGLSLKMDIEGAEFSLLRDENLLKFLKSSNSIMFLSFHPGFQSPLPNKAKILEKLVWRIATLRDTAKFVALLKRYSKITFKNEEKQLSQMQILFRIIRGDRDFTLYF
jgi:FkbM family methyltransferase